MIIKEIYFGYVDNKNNINIKQMIMSDYGLKTTSKYLNIRLISKTSWENSLYNSRRDFHIESTNVTNDESIYIKLINDLYARTQSNPTEIKNIFDKNNHTPYEFIMYLGKTENTNKIMGTIFKLKNSFITKKSKIFAKVNGQSTATLIKNNKYIQLPLENNILTFYIDNSNDDIKNLALHIFQPNEFDKLFKKDSLQIKFAEQNMKKFKNKDFVITKDDIPVEFVRDDLQSDDFENILEYIKNKKAIIDDISSYSGNGNLTIRKLSIDYLNRVIKELKDWTKSKDHNKFNETNIPQIKNKKLYVTKDSIPIFSALLNNRIIKKLLSDEIKIPFFDELEK